MYINWHKWINPISLFALCFSCSIHSTLSHSVYIDDQGQMGLLTFVFVFFQAHLSNEINLISFVSVCARHDALFCSFSRRQDTLSFMYYLTFLSVCVSFSFSRCRPSLNTSDNTTFFDNKVLSPLIHGVVQTNVFIFFCCCCPTRLIVFWLHDHLRLAKKKGLTQKIPIIITIRAVWERKHFLGSVELAG